jgi:hypothetical protein
VQEAVKKGNEMMQASELCSFWRRGEYEEGREQQHERKGLGPMMRRIRGACGQKREVHVVQQRRVYAADSKTDNEEQAKSLTQSRNWKSGKLTRSWTKK